MIDLANIWNEFQNVAACLRTTHTCMVTLLGFSDYIHETDAIADRLEGSLDFLSDTQRLENTNAMHIDPAGLACNMRSYKSIANRYKIQFSGFCPWALVEGKGLLIPGNPNMGVLQWKGYFYSVSSLEAARAFGTEPDKYLDGVDIVAIQNPALIHLLQMEHQVFSPVVPGSKPVNSKKRYRMHCDVEVQTEVHPVKRNWVNRYTWNEWEYRRRTLQLGTLLKCKTKSQQTLHSNYRRENTTQVWLPKHKNCQTKRDQFTNVPKPCTYIFGVRGKPIGRPHEVLNLTLPTDDTAYDIWGKEKHVLKPSGVYKKTSSTVSVQVDCN